VENSKIILYVTQDYHYWEHEENYEVKRRYDLLSMYCNVASIKKSPFLRSEMNCGSFPHLSRLCAQLSLQNVGVSPVVTWLITREHIDMKTLPLFRDFLYSEELTIVFVILSFIFQKHKFNRKAQRLWQTVTFKWYNNRNKPYLPESI
jgi:hypothetical protein